MFPLDFLRKIIRKAKNFSSVKGFDAKFYTSHYNDLKHIKGKRAALKHYINNGRAEGRFPNRELYLANLELLQNELRPQFDLAAYKHFNKDLASRFDTEQEFFQHYVNHGHKEGRKCRFDDVVVNNVIVYDEDKWKSIFSTSDFIAFCGNKLEILPKTREEAIDIFINKGIDNLWPISFDYAFDARFLRENRLMPDIEDMSDIDLYRSWLTQGFPSGIPSNERMFLFSYLGGLPFPLNFDWETYAKNACLPLNTTRSQALISLFNSSAGKIMQYIDLMGRDAAWLLDCIGRRALINGDRSKAAEMFQKSTDLTPTAEPFCLLGDAYREMGATENALQAYLSSINIGRAPIWSFLHAANIYADRGDFLEAFDVMRKASHYWRQKAEFGNKLQELVQRYFDYQSARAHALYRETTEKGPKQVHRSTIDALLTSTLDDIKTIYTELESIPTPIGGDPEGYVAILANDDLRQCTHYRIEQKKLQFDYEDIPVRIFSHSDVQGFIDSLIGARSAIFYRVAATPHILKSIIYANNLGIDTYYEVDDLIFDSSCYPDSFSSFEGQITSMEYAGLQFGVPLFRYAMMQCTKCIASTPALAKKMQEVSKRCEAVVIRNGLDERNEPAITMGSNPIRRTDGRIRIFYGSGTKAHNADFNRLVAPALLHLMQRYAHVDLVIVGHLKLMPELEAMKERIIRHSFISDVTAYWSILASCDINLAVLEPGIVADCKSEIKWLEAAVLQVPSVVSGTKTYREILTEGEDGFIAETPDQWKAILDTLISDPEQRAAIGRKARKKALRDYSIEVGAATLKEIFPSAVNTLRKHKEKRIKILVCNVFYAPQSYGGATRVVEDNIRTFQERYPDLDIAVFCSQDGGLPPGRLSIGSENGVPVYRLCTPQEVNMDWRPFNDAHAEKFEEVLDHFKPDIIHFHCIQRLTATIVEVALRRNIPYLVTLHDAWWISDNQFLVDKDGLLQLPGTDPISDCQNSQHGLTSITRRQRLASLLQNAQANLSVSKSFADIYTKAGIAKVRVVENGSPSIQKADHIQRTDGRVALGHIGGRSAHKGAALIEATLRMGNYKNLHLTMVDGTLSLGQSINSIWGTTPITLTAPFPQSQVAQLYGELNILLAPSTWPESFGLVTREALSSGLWVIASNLGAIGQDIVEDRNGYVIDVTTTEQLSDILTKIDADPTRYLNTPEFQRSAMRSMADQAKEIWKIYHDIYECRPFKN